MVIQRTNSLNPDFKALVVLLDNELKITDGEKFPFFSQFNTLTDIQHVLVAYDENQTAVGCGALKAYDSETVEVKRMYVLPTYRRKKVAMQILQMLEHWAKEMQYKRCILETGILQTAAIRLYEQSNFVRTENYGQYEGVAESVCFEKKLYL